MRKIQGHCAVNIHSLAHLQGRWWVPPLDLHLATSLSSANRALENMMQAGTRNAFVQSGLLFHALSLA